MDEPRAEKEASRDVIFIIALMRAKMDDGEVDGGRGGGSTVRSRAAPSQRRSLLSALF